MERKAVGVSNLDKENKLANKVGTKPVARTQYKGFKKNEDMKGG